MIFNAVMDSTSLMGMLIQQELSRIQEKRGNGLPLPRITSEIDDIKFKIKCQNIRVACAKTRHTTFGRVRDNSM